MALAFSVKSPAKNLAGLRMRLVNITFDALYVNGTGYVITPANCKLKNKILSISSPRLAAFSVSPTLSGVNAVLKVYKGAAGVDVEAATNEATLDTLVGMFTVWGY